MNKIYDFYISVTPTTQRIPAGWQGIQQPSIILAPLLSILSSGRILIFLNSFTLPDCGLSGADPFPRFRDGHMTQTLPIRAFHFYGHSHGLRDGHMIHARPVRLNSCHFTGPIGKEKFSSHRGCLIGRMGVQGYLQPSCHHEENLPPSKTIREESRARTPREIWIPVTNQACGSSHPTLLVLGQ